MQNDNIFIFTEIINVGKIGKIAIDSFLKYHPDLTINVYGKPSDFAWLTAHPQVVWHDIESETDIVDGFNQGHLGTAKLWAKLIMSVDEKYMLHFDSDIIFRGNIVQDIIDKVEEGYDLIGACRNYKNNLCFRDDVRHLDDVVATGCFVFNKSLITKDYNYDEMTRMCQGFHNPIGEPVLDFFDPVSFDILKNGGKIWFLDFNEAGGCNREGSRDNVYADLNNMNTPFKIEFGSKMSHFSAVGSGMNFFHNPEKIHDVPDSYKNYAIDRYALFCKIFYDEESPNIDVSQYNRLFDGIEWY